MVENELKLEVGKTIKPFEGRILPPFPKLEFDSSSELEMEHLECEILTLPVGLFGIKGNLRLTVTLEPESSEVADPLGSVRSIRRFENGKIIIEESPLYIGIEFFVHTFDQFEILRRHDMSFVIGNKSYWLCCGGNDDSDEMRKRLINRDDLGKPEKVYDIDLLPDSEGEGGTVCLPYDEDKLSTIEMTVVEVFSVPKN